MKKYIQFYLVVLFTATQLLFAQNLTAHYNVDDSKIGLAGYSPVSYIDLGLAQRGLKEFKSVHDGINYYFTNADQKAAFEKNPEKYLPAYGGFCAFGIAVGARFRVDPNKFLVSDGKLYLFLYDLEVDAQQLWLQGDEKDLRQKADANWKQLKAQS